MNYDHILTSLPYERTRDVGYGPPFRDIVAVLNLGKAVVEAQKLQDPEKRRRAVKKQGYTASYLSHFARFYEAFATHPDIRRLKSYSQRALLVLPRMDKAVRESVVAESIASGSFVDDDPRVQAMFQKAVAAYTERKAKRAAG